MVSKVYIVRKRGSMMQWRVNAASENKAVAKVIAKHGGFRANYFVYEF